MKKKLKRLLKRDQIKTRIELMEEIKTLKIKLVDDIEDVIKQHYFDRLPQSQSGVPKLAPVDIISALELVKLKFYCNKRNEIPRKILQTPEGKNNDIR